LLAIDKISCSYNGVPALEDVSILVSQRQIVSIIGANGAGKSTLMKSISGILTPRGGQIIFKGERIDRLPSHEIVRKGIALVPEGRQIFAPLTVLENLTLGAYQFFTHKGRNEERINDLMALVFRTFPALRSKRNKPAGTCSGGEQQMLAIGRALMSNPRLLLLDEPSLGLSPLIVEEIFRVLDELYHNGLTVLLVEQNARIGLSFAHYAYVLEVGHIALEGKTEDLTADERVIISYIGG